MNDNKLDIWKQSQPRQLIGVLVAIDDRIIMQNFLRDVLTEKEITEIAARLEAARMLKAGTTYSAVTKATKLSSRTIARISDLLQNGCRGYEAALQLIETHHLHIPPVRAE